MTLKITALCLLIIFFTTVIPVSTWGIRDHLFNYANDTTINSHLDPYIQEHNLTLAFMNHGPEIHLLPKNLSFSKDSWKSGDSEIIDLTIYNPENISILDAIIKLKIPSGWEYNPEIENDVIHFDPDEVLFWVSSFNESYAHTWIELKPGPNVRAGEYRIYADSKVSFLNDGISDVANVINTIDITVVDDSQESGHNLIKDNTWVFIMISAICGSLTLFLNRDFRGYLKNKIHKLEESLKND
jgi:hypothetical protein